jgi:hypothetical protein
MAVENLMSYLQTPAPYRAPEKPVDSPKHRSSVGPNLRLPKSPHHLMKQRMKYKVFSASVLSSTSVA